MDNPRVFLDINVGEEPAGRLIIELFIAHAPKTAENFRQLCTGEHDGLSYDKTPFHRVIDEFMVQGGDIEKGDGTGTVSIYGAEFEDENLEWREIDAAGLVCSANRGKNTNGSQFFITLDQSTHLNGKHTIFGRLVTGENVLKTIAAVPVDDQDRPLTPVLVARCGELEKRRKKVATSARPIEASNNNDRGRRRRSDEDMIEGQRHDNSPLLVRRTRRQSDNVVDEGIRGRPRIRSKSCGSSDAISEADEPTDASSPARKHKRKRSISPSRRIDRRFDDQDEERRRRRSLPNQYNDRFREDDRYRPSPRRDRHRYAGHRNEDDRYRPSHDRPHEEGRLKDDDGRLGGSSYPENDPPVHFKGRGVMKYRENRQR